MIWNDYNVCTQVSHIKISGKLMRPLRACGHASITQAEISWLPSAAKLF